MDRSDLDLWACWGVCLVVEVWGCGGGALSETPTLATRLGARKCAPVLYRQLGRMSESTLWISPLMMRTLFLMDHALTGKIFCSRCDVPDTAGDWLGLLAAASCSMALCSVVGCFDGDSASA